MDRESKKETYAERVRRRGRGQWSYLWDQLKFALSVLPIFIGVVALTMALQAFGVPDWIANPLLVLVGGAGLIWLFLRSF